MKKMMVKVILAMGLAFSVAGTGLAAAPPMIDKPLAGKSQVSCPVQGGKINKELYADYKGQRVYFCCPACIPIFKKDPENYLRKMRQQGVVPGKIPGGN